jgi:hypothetical protein
MINTERRRARNIWGALFHVFIPKKAKREGQKPVKNARKHHQPKGLKASGS